MGLVFYQLAALRCNLAGILSFDFVAEDAVFVNLGAQDQISCLLLDEDVSIGADLVKPSRRPNSEDRLPRVLPRQVVVQLICKLHGVLVHIELRVKVETSRAGAGQIRERLYVLELLLTSGENE